MNHIFISYSRDNKLYARALANELLRRGFDLWIDDSIDYGEEWWQVIVKAIRECGAFLIIMTPESDESRWVQREVMLADHLPKPIFPLLLDGDLINSKTWTMFLGRQYADVHDGRLPKDDFYERLYRVVAPKTSPGTQITPAQPTLIATKPPAAKNPASDSGILSRSALKPIPQQNESRKLPPIVKADWAGRGKLLPEPFEWCVLPTGIVTLGAGGYVSKMTPFEVTKFEIARYPVTNAQFMAFVQAKDGWRDVRWWNYSEAAKVWREANAQGYESYFNSCADCPHETVAWFSALAFTRWLSVKTNEKITLPTEQQWQRAAQGDDERSYPWGDGWNVKQCNSWDSDVRKTTPVKQYPQGASPFGVFDMCGNVWEWCLTEWNTGGIDLGGSAERVLRGGSWYLDNADDLRVTNRHRRNPVTRDNYIGFRCVRYR